MRAFLSTLIAITTLPLCAEVTLKETEGNLEALIDGKLFTTYRSDTRVPCLYPLLGPSGAHLTRQYPFVKGVAGEQSDHPHHTGFWFTHGLVNGKDFWHKPDCRIVHREYLAKKADKNNASFTVRLEWRAGDTLVIDEERTYHIAVDGKTRTIDTHTTLTASGGDVLFGDTKEGSFAIRLAPTLRLKGKVAKGHIVNSEGHKDGAAWGKRAKWVAYHGPDGKGEPVVVALFDHSSNLRHPTWWHARDYGLLAANPFGHHDFEKKKDAHLGDFTLKKGTPLKQRYRLLLHQGDIESAKIEESWKEFSK